MGNSPDFVGPPEPPELHPVPDGDTVHRSIYFPHMEAKRAAGAEPPVDLIDRRHAFHFKPENGRYAISCICGSIAGSIRAVHEIGCRKLANDNARKEKEAAEKGKKATLSTYEGCIAAAPELIRDARPQAYRFKVMHEPVEGIESHVAVERWPIEGALDGKEKGEIRNLEIDATDELYKAFGKLAQHTCPAMPPTPKELDSASESS